MKPFMIVRLRNIEHRFGPATVVRLVDKRTDLQKFQDKAVFPEMLEMWPSIEDVTVGDTVYKYRNLQPQFAHKKGKKSAYDVLAELRRLDEKEERTGLPATSQHLYETMREAGVDLFGARKYAAEHVSQEEIDRGEIELADIRRFIRAKKGKVRR
jgi:hypothetical protein